MLLDFIYNNTEWTVEGLQSSFLMLVRDFGNFYENFSLFFPYQRDQKCDLILIHHFITEIEVELMLKVGRGRKCYEKLRRIIMNWIVKVILYKDIAWEIEQTAFLRIIL